MIPRFRENDYYGGLDAGTNVLMSLAAGEYNYDSYAGGAPSGAIPGVVIFLIILFFIIIVSAGSSNNKHMRRSGSSNLPLWLLMSMMGRGRSHSGSWGGFSGGGGGFGGGGGGGFGGFGGGGGGQQQRRFRGSDLRVKVRLNLKEIANGVEKKFKLKKYVPCSHCHGSGAEDNSGSETCPTCKGSGTVIRNQQTILGTMQTRTTCPTCGGEGKIVKNKCKHCNGDGIEYGEEVVSVNIPAGVMEGMQLSMQGKGNAGKRNGIPGDLLIQVEEEAHPELIRDENDLIYNLLLSVPTAALGGAVEIPTIDSKVKVKIDPGTQPGKVLRLRGKGLPSVNGYGTGDLLVNVSVYIPEALSKDEKAALEKLEGSDNFKPSSGVKEKIFKKFRNFFD